MVELMVPAYRGNQCAHGATDLEVAKLAENVAAMRNASPPPEATVN
jgi:hypothetical protein